MRPTRLQTPSQRLRSRPAALRSLALSRHWLSVALRRHAGRRPSLGGPDKGLVPLRALGLGQLCLAGMALLLAAGCSPLGERLAPRAAPAKETKALLEISWPEPEVSSFKLANGIRCFLIEDHELPVIEAKVMIRGGSFLEPSDKAGLARMVGMAMRSGGSTRYPAETLNRLLADKAARIETAFEDVSGTAQLSCLSEDFSELLPVFADVLRQPAFPQNKIQLARRQLKTQIARRNDQQSDIARRVFKDLVYGPGSIYAREPEYSTVDAITRQDLFRFHSRAFQGANLMIGLIGDFETETVRPQLREAFGGFPAGTKQAIELPAVETAFEPALRVVGKRDVNQSYILVGHLGGYRQNPDFAALQVMNKVLSGGFSGRLFEKVRTEMGLAYAVFGRYGCHYYYPGTFFVGLKTKTEATAKAVTVVRQELEKLQEGIGQAELDQAKEQFFNSLVFRYDQAEEILSRRMYYAYRGMPQDSFSELVEAIRKVTAEDVVAAARKYVHPEGLTVLTVGEEGKLVKQLETLGPVEVLPQP